MVGWGVGRRPGFRVSGLWVEGSHLGGGGRAYAGYGGALHSCVCVYVHACVQLAPRWCMHPCAPPLPPLHLDGACSHALHPCPPCNGWCMQPCAPPLPPLHLDGTCSLVLLQPRPVSLHHAHQQPAILLLLALADHGLPAGGRQRECQLVPVSLHHAHQQPAIILLLALADHGLPAGGRQVDAPVPVIASY